MVAQEGLHPPADIVSVELYKVPPSDCATHDLCEGSFCFTIWRNEMKLLATTGKVNLCQASVIMHYISPLLACSFVKVNLILLGLGE